VVRKIRVQLIDDHSVVRAGVRMLVNYQADMEVVSEASSAIEAVRQARGVRPDVMVLDIGLPGCSGLDAIAPLREASPKSRILILSTHDDQAYLRLALAAGAAGYVAKQATAAELTQAIRTVARGRSYVNVTLAGSQALKTVLHDRRPPMSPVDALSKREKQVLTLVASGHTNQAAAEELALSVKTVETYRRRLMEKLGITGRAGLLRVALQCGLIARAGEPEK
jgi:two-component system, NarL family, response regulator NreC